MKKEVVFIALLIFLAVAMRFWNFRGYLSFLDDQGRDALVAKHILIDHDFTLLGPGTSVGNMYLGPLYYYAMVPFLALTYPDPTGPAYAVAWLGVITVVLVYTLGKRLVGPRAAAIAAIAYAVTPAAVQLSRFSWQPNPAPFVGLLMMWWTVEALKGKTWRWFAVGVCFAVLIQLHYVALLSIIPSGLLFMYDFWKRRAVKGAVKKYVSIVFASLAVLVLTQLPLVIFDLRHDGLIRDGFVKFMQSQGSSTPLLERLGLFFVDMHGRGMYVLVELLGFSKEIRLVNTIVLVLFTGLILWQLLPRVLKKNPYKIEFTVVSLWVVLGVIGLSAYRWTVYTHYFAYLFPAILLLFGSTVAFLSKKHFLVCFPACVFFIGIVFWNIITAPYWKPKTADIDRIKSVAQDMLPEIGDGTRYNLALLNENREYRAMKYRYFFEVFGTPPQSQYDYTDLQKLLVITENGESPLEAPIFEIQQFTAETKDPQLMTTKTYQDIVSAYLYERVE